MWKAAVTLLIVVIIAAGAMLALPAFATNLIVDALREQTAAEDVQISITDSPRLIFGEIGAVDGVMRQGRIGKIFVRELTLTGTGLHIAPMTLLTEHKAVLTSAETAELRGVIDAEAIRELITKSSGKFEDVVVTVTPTGVTATAKTKALGQTFDVTLEGAFEVVSGDLYYKIRRISARGRGMNTLSLDSLFPDVVVARADALPLGLTFRSVEARDDVVIVTAGKDAP
ncbi:MAG: DUF2993 domain-containing protein [Selenomonas artemidis]|nr:DUF2993 domain-containing protein [Selenomonas artemidis]